MGVPGAGVEVAEGAAVKDGTAVGEDVDGAVGGSEKHAPEKNAPIAIKAPRTNRGAAGPRRSSALGSTGSLIGRVSWDQNSI